MLGLGGLGLERGGHLLLGGLHGIGQGLVGLGQRRGGLLLGLGDGLAAFGHPPLGLGRRPCRIGQRPRGFRRLRLGRRGRSRGLGRLSGEIRDTLLCHGVGPVRRTGLLGLRALNRVARLRQLLQGRAGLLQAIAPLGEGGGFLGDRGDRLQLLGRHGTEFRGRAGDLRAQGAGRIGQLVRCRVGLGRRFRGGAAGLLRPRACRVCRRHAVCRDRERAVNGGHRLPRGFHGCGGRGGGVANRFGHLRGHGGQLLPGFACGRKYRGVIGTGLRPRDRAGLIGDFFLLGRRPFERLRGPVQLADFHRRRSPLRIGDRGLDLAPRAFQGRVDVADGVGRRVGLRLREVAGRLRGLVLRFREPAADGGRQRLVSGRRGQDLGHLGRGPGRGPGIRGDCLLRLPAEGRRLRRTGAGLLQRHEPLGKLHGRHGAACRAVLALERGGDLAEVAEHLARGGIGLRPVGLEDRRGDGRDPLLRLLQQRRGGRTAGDQRLQGRHLLLHVRLGGDEAFDRRIVERGGGDFLADRLDLGNRRADRLERLFAVVADDSLGLLDGDGEALERGDHPLLGSRGAREVGRFEPLLRGAQAAAQVADAEEPEAVGRAFADQPAPLAHVDEVGFQPLAERPHGPLGIERLEDPPLPVRSRPGQIANRAQGGGFQADQPADLGGEVGHLQSPQELVPLLRQADDDRPHLVTDPAHFGRRRRAAGQGVDDGLHLALHEAVDGAAHGGDFRMDR